MKNIGYSFNGFTTARLKRFLKTGGQKFSFVEWELNGYNEPTGNPSFQKDILGVLHRSFVRSQAGTSVGSTTRSNSSTSIITSWESLAAGFSGGKELSAGMTVNINGMNYKAIKIENLNSWGIVAEISLEEFDDWSTV